MAKTVLIDTNVWVSAIINPHGYPAKIVKAWLDDRFEVVISLPLLEEIAEVLRRPRIKEKYGIDDDEIGQLLTLLVEKCRLVVLTGTLKICRDPDDDLILETAISGQADYMVSRDDNIKGDEQLILEMSSQGITVLTVSNFLAKLEERSL